MSAFDDHLDNYGDPGPQTYDCPPPVLISLADMPALFGVAQQTAWRWNTNKGGPGGLPEPDGRLGAVPYWFEDTIREWAGSRRNKLTVDEKVMDQLRVNVRPIR